MKVKREALLRMLESVKAGVESKESAENTDCFVFRNGHVYTYNDEVCCSAPSPMGDELSGAIKATLFLEMLRKLPEEEVTVEVRDGLLYVQGQKRLSKFRLEADVAETFGDVGEPKKWRKLPDDFNEAVNLVQNCAGKDESKFNTVCIHLSAEHIEAFDNFQLYRWTIATGLKEPILLRQIGLRHVPLLGMTEFGESQSWCHFRNPDGVHLACRRYLEDDYPDLGEFLAKVGNATTLTLSKGLAEAVDKAMLFSKENGPDTDAVCVELKTGKIRVKADGVSGGYSESKKSSYKGKPFAFYIKPQILIDLLNRHNEYQVNENWIHVKSASFEYLACLIRPDEVTTEAEEYAEVGADE